MSIQAEASPSRKDDVRRMEVVGSAVGSFAVATLKAFAMRGSPSYCSSSLSLNVQGERAVTLDKLRHRGFASQNPAGGQGKDLLCPV